MAAFLALGLAIVGAAGSVLSAYIAAKVREVAIISNGKLLALENEIRLTRALLDASENRERAASAEIDPSQ